MSTHEQSSSPLPPPTSPPPTAPAGEQQLGAQGSNTTMQTPSSQQPGGDTSPFGSAVVQECLQSAQRFRGGEYSREEAIWHIFDTLGSANQPRELVIQGARPYIDMVDSIVGERHNAELRGRVLAHAPGGLEHPAEFRQRSPSIAPTVSVGSKRRRAEPDSDSDNDGDRGGKRPLDLSALPWMQNVEATPLPQQLADTRRLLILFAQEPKRWKTFFTNEPNCPQFPGSEWTNIIAGQPINLDLVLASMFNVAIDHKLKERVGRVSLTLDEVNPTKLVRSQGEWLSAWARTVDATAFVFRHRRDELTAYGGYISSMFTSVLEANHFRVLSYDRAVRHRVSDRRDLYLTDVSQFTDLHTQWLSSVGAGPGSAPPRSGGARASGKSSKTEACRRWNDGKCPFPANKCNWAHVCVKCSGAHTAGVCTQRA